MSTATVTATGQDTIRRAADRLEATTPRGRLRRRRTLEALPEGDQLVLRAVRRAVDGDDDALRFLFLRYADNVYGYVCSVVRDEHEAEDVTQLVFAKLMTALPRYEPRAVPFSAWLLRIAHNAAIDHLRVRRAVPVAEVYGPHAAAEDGGRERGEALREALAELPDDQRMVIVLRFVQGLTPREVASRLGRSEEAVASLQHRGRTRLRAELERRDAGPAALAPAA